MNSNIDHKTNNLDNDFQGAAKTHQDWIDLWGDEQTYAQAHTEFGSELEREFGMERTFVSVTDDPGVAESFVGDGRVYKGTMSEDQLVIPNVETSTEREYLVRGGTNELEIYSEGGVLVESEDNDTIGGEEKC